MLKAYSRLRLAVLGVGIVVAALICGYQFLYAIPKEKCDDAGLWWASKWRRCVSPVDITTLTGRPIPKPAEPGAPVPTVPQQAQPAVK